MEAQSQDLHVRLLVDNEQQQMNQEQTRLVPEVEEVESLECEGNPRGSTSFFRTCFNGLNALSGIGLLSISYALASAGWLSLTLLFAIAIVSFYTGLLMQRCMDLDPSIRTYPDIGDRAFGKKGRVLISVFMCSELFLVATGLLILEGDNLYKLIPEFGIKGVLSGKQSFILIVALVVLPTVWVDNLGILSYVSASGILASGIILLSIFWTGAFDGVGFRQKGKLVNWSGIPTAVSLYSLCYCAHPVFPTIYTSMKKKHQFSYVLMVCYILCTIGYASMAVMGYLMFGDAVESQITLNLPTGKLSSKVAIYTTLASPICKYALMVIPILNAAKHMPCWSQKKRLHRILLGTALVISTVIVALCVPFFGYLMSLVGALLNVATSIILPCLCYLKISGSYRSFRFRNVVIWAIILPGVALAVSGTYTALRQIIVRL